MVILARRFSHAFPKARMSSFKSINLGFALEATFEQAAENAVMQHVATSYQECVHSRHPLHFDTLEWQPV
jgi:hypothetical protein